MAFRLPSGFWELSRPLKALLDVLVWAGATFAAFVLRLEAGPAEWWRSAAVLAVAGAPTFVFAVSTFGLHRQSWGSVGMRDIPRLAGAAALTGSALFALTLLLRRLEVPYLIPLSVPAIAAMLALLGAGALRFATRMLREG